ncbi:MAG TPA: tyrosine-protein phosphatase [Candidatus Saccharimonadales bacterium]
MKRPTFQYRLILTAVFFLCLFLSSAALAILKSSDTYAACGGVDTSVVSCGEDDSNAIWALLLIVVNVMAGLVGVAAIGGFVYAAILYSSAGDKSGQVTKAKETLANVVLGLVLFALMWAFVQFLIPGGVFGRDYSAPEATNTPTARTNDENCNCKDESGNGSGGVQGPVTPSAIKIKNFRDASVTTNGSVLKPGTLYRSVHLGNLGPKKAEKLGQLLKGGTVIDLRTSEQKADNKADVKLTGVSQPARLNILGYTSGIGPAVVDPARMPKFGKALRMMGNASGPVLVHCISGKDRTGWTVAMVMYIAGAKDPQIKKEYAESAKAFPNLAEFNPDWINSGLSSARKKYGGDLNRYLKEGLGLTDKDITKIRNKFKA